MARLLIFLLAGWAGFLVMAIELLSGRILAPYFGSSIYVWGGIITVFMLALAIGYLLGGRWSLRDPTLCRLAALLMTVALALVPAELAQEGTEVAVVIRDKEKRARVIKKPFYRKNYKK